MTENMGAACTMSPLSTTVGTVGSPICATEIKLVGACVSVCLGVIVIVCLCVCVSVCGEQTLTVSGDVAKT